MIKLKEVASYVSEKVDTGLLKVQDYITTDNMLSNRGGIIISNNLPQADKVTKFERDDILVSNIRPYFKKIWYATFSGGCSNDVIVFRGNGINSKFLYYVLSQNVFFDYMMAGANGTKMPRGNKKLIPDFEFLNFSPVQQEHISSILSAFDDLIENNKKQIKLLEEAAQRLYKEWFIDLRFPGHENVEVVDGVPEGWTRKTVLDCLETYIGGGWGKEDITSKNTIAGKVIRGTDINDIKSGIYTGIPLRYHTENDKKKRTLKKNDIVFELSNGNIDNIGRSLLIDELILNNCGENTICASFCKLFRPLDKIHSLLLYLEILDMNSSGRMLPYKKQGSNGINNFAFEDFLLHELLIPSDYKMVAFIDTIMSKIMVARSQLALLQEVRNRLLPKLMGGEIEV